MIDQRHGSENRPRPSLMDWALVAINTAFVVAGLVILPREPDGGIVTIAFFGSCLAVSIGTVVRKLRDRRFAAETVAVTGGVPIRPSTALMPFLGGWLAILGTIMFVFGSAYPLVFRILSVFVAIVGGVLLILSLTRRIPAGYLQFDPEGLTIAHRTWRARVPWNDIDGVHESEFASNPMLLISVADPARLDIEPPNAHAAAMREIARTQTTMGAEFAIMTRHYGIDLPLLAATVARYVQDRDARAELRARLT